MAITYPTSLDNFTNPTGTDLLENSNAALDHDVQHSNANDAIEALQAKVGADSSAVTTSHDYKLSEVTSSDKAVGKTATQTLTNKTLTSPVINVGSDATGDMYYRNASGAFTRLPAGTDTQIIIYQSGIPTVQNNPAGSDASTTVKGVVEIATTSEIDAGTSTGGTGASLAVRPDQLLASSVVTTPMKLFFGTGADGSVTISSNTTLTRDMHYTNLTINSSIVLSTGGYRIYVSGTLTNNGTIRNNGSNGSGTTAGAGGAAGSLGGGKNGATGTTNGTTIGGAGGGGGGTVWIAANTISVEGTIEAKGGNGANASYVGGTTNNSVGSAGSSSAKTLITSGAGGNGGAGSSSGGGSGGTITTTTMDTQNPLFMIFQVDTVSMVSLTGGAGGGSGGYDVPGGGAGGGGGGQGGVIFEMYKTLTTSGTRTVTGGSGGSAGGSGGAGTSGSSGVSVTLQI